MGFFAFIITIFLALSLGLSFIRRGRFILTAKLLRFFIVLASTGIIAFWFVRSSVTPFQKNAMVLQIINKLPQPIDFYILKVNPKDASSRYVLKHSGIIRPEYYRIEYLKMDRSNEYWIAGYLGKKNMVYFSQHLVPNRNMDQIVEIDNYLNQSLRLSGKAAEEISTYRSQISSTAIWISLSFLLIFLNIVLLIRRK